MLARLADLVDKYGFETVDMFSDSWIAELEGTANKSNHDELYYWISISWVFRNNEIFQEATKIVLTMLSQLDCEKALAGIEAEFDLPLPIRALGNVSTHLSDNQKANLDQEHITNQRKVCFENIYEMISKKIALYTESSEHICPNIYVNRNNQHTYNQFNQNSQKTWSSPAQQQVCDTLVLGTLLRGLESNKSIWPMSEKVCRQLSWTALRDHIGSIKITSACKDICYGKDPQSNFANCTSEGRRFGDLD